MAISLAAVSQRHRDEWGVVMNGVAVIIAKRRKPSGKHGSTGVWERFTEAHVSAVNRRACALPLLSCPADLGVGESSESPYLRGVAVKSFRAINMWEGS